MNNESFSENNNQSTEQPINSIGPKLRRAREELRLTITDIARQLRLTEERIESLENNDYQDMPGITFLKGYLRAYARLVNLPADELILDFERLNLIPETKSFTVSSYKQPMLLSNKSLRWVIYLIGIGLLVLAATWWNSSTSNDPANLNGVDAKHPSTKNVPPTGALTANTLSIASSTNVAKPAEAANTVPGSVNGTSASQNQTAPTPTTSPSSSASPSSASPAAPTSTPSVSTEPSDQQTARTNASEATIEDASDEPQPRKKPAARRSRPQIDDEPVEDQYY